MGKPVFRTFGGREVRLTNQEKLLFPDDGITKAMLIEHVVTCAEPLLAALRDRPLSMERRVDGLAGEGFFHKHKPAHFPDWVRTVTLPTSKGAMEQVVVDDLPTLVLVTNFGCMTPHVPVSTVSSGFHPDQLVVDLDPSTDDLAKIREAGHLVRARLEELGLPSYPRWSGSRGIHVVVPLDQSAPQDAVVALGDGIARSLVKHHPDHFTLAFKKADRGDRIYVDVGRNYPGATVVASWAVRARPTAPVAMPVRWDEIDDTSPRHFTIRTAPSRLTVDAWAGFDGDRVDARRFDPS
jgi:bifunctional non-homologous end joining protein LigD